MTAAPTAAVVTSSRPRISTIRVNGIRLPEGAPRRVPDRPHHARQPDFDERFDFDTLFYDALWGPDRRSVRLIGPSLLNLELPVSQSTFVAQPSAAACAVRITQLDRACEIMLSVPAGTETIEMRGPLGDIVIQPSQPRFATFAGQRVIFTLSKNNHLQWITDWVRYYRDVHGAEGVLIYDNASTAYSATELATALGEVRGLKTVVVVEWPFRHGPPGFGEHGYWDSNFSQLGTFAHARWNLLHDASSVLNCDIDELVVARGRRGVFELAERSLFGVVSFTGNWMFGIEGQTARPSADRVLRFTDYKHKLRGRWTLKRLIPVRADRCRSKWAAVPARTPSAAQWHIHAINGWLASRVRSLQLSFRHFREINFNWKYDRLQRQPFDGKRHVLDREFQRCLARVRWDV
jgi:hypothetical protein